MDCPFCGCKEFEGKRCLNCGMNKDAFNQPNAELIKPVIEKKVEEVKKVEVKKPIAKVEVKRSHKKK